jgi:hypothetical protein
MARYAAEGMRQASYPSILRLVDRRGGADESRS